MRYNSTTGMITLPHGFGTINAGPGLTFFEAHAVTREWLKGLYPTPPITAIGTICTLLYLQVHCGISLAYIADVLDKHPSYISRYLAGKTLLTDLEAIERLAFFSGVKKDVLLHILRERLVYPELLESAKRRLNTHE